MSKSTGGTWKKSAIAAALALCASSAHAQSVADFYRGKIIDFSIGAATAGGYDLAGRLLANHLPRHIPGNPAIIVHNVPRATGLIMMNSLYNVGQPVRPAIGRHNSNG